MEAVTYFVTMPFVRGEDGEIVTGEAVEPTTASAAEREARRMAVQAVDAVAFSRTGDTTSGEFEDAIVIAQFGEAPSADHLFGE